LAALAATSAFAQSTVTISGNVDLGLRNIKETATVGNVEGTRKQSGLVGNGASANAAGWTSSALKLTVNEDLGNGQKAGYVAEMNLNSFGGSAVATEDTTLGSQRQSYAYMAGGFGEGRIGFQYTLEDQIQGGIGRNTPTGNTGGRIQNFGFSADTNANAAAIAAGATVRANAVEYSTPTVNGFKGLVQWGNVKDETTVTAATLDTQANTKYSGLGATYSSGPLNLGASYTSLATDAQTLNTANSIADVKNKHTNIAANYDLGVAKLFANYHSRKAEATGTTAANLDVTKRKGYDLGVSVPMGKVTLFANYGKGNFKMWDNSAADQLNAKLSARQLAATYDFSKRTSVTAYYSVNKATGEEALDGVSYKRTYLGAGLRHQF
jgi:predicted porin